MTRRLPSRSLAMPMLLAAMVVARPSITEADCPGIPALCGMTCSPDAYGTPIYCSNGQCSCAPGYDTQSAPGGGLVCQPIQPEVIGTESNNNSCPGICPAAMTTAWATVGSIYNAFDLVPVHGIAPGGEAFMPVWGYQATQCGDHGTERRNCRGGSNNRLACSTATDCPGGTCALFQTCQGGSNNGLACTAATDCPGGTCALFQTWAGCAPDPFPFCSEIQGADQGNFDPPSCQSSAGCGKPTCDNVVTMCSGDPTASCNSDADCNHGMCNGGSCSGDSLVSCFSDADCNHGPCTVIQGSGTCSDDATASCTSATDCDIFCTSDFTSAWPYIDHSIICEIGSSIGVDAKTTNPARIDFSNNVSVYRAPTRWEGFDPNFIDKDYTWDMEIPGHELHDTDTQFAYHQGCPDETHGRIHIEFDSTETVDHFAVDDWGAANEWWRVLRTAAAADRENTVRCFVKSFVNPDLTCPEDVDLSCMWHDPLAVVVGVPSMDCADDPYQGTDEIHPVLGMAIRIQEDPRQPEQWAFFYRQHGNTGPCGSNGGYSRCLSTFKLPLGLPGVPDNGVLTGADVHVDWHAWATDDSTPSDVTVEGVTTSPVQGHFDLTNGTVLTIKLPHDKEGVVGLVTVTPAVDTTPPTITCPGNISKPVDLGKCTAAVTFPAPTVSDDCSVSAVCNPPSGSAFPIGTTTDTCTATDQAGLTASCNFNVTVTAGNKCPHDVGYWKKNPALWPVNSLTLGTVTYNKTQLLNILNNSTTGDASVILAKAEIATLLSLANGSNPTPICNTIADANAALDGSTVPAKVGPSTVLGQRMVSDSNTLNSYNSGNLTPGCTR